MIAVRKRRELQLRASCGFPTGSVERLFPLPVDGKYPICSAVRTGRAVCLDSFVGAAAEYPLLLPIWTSGGRSMAAVPIRRFDRVTGAIGWSFSESQTFQTPQLQYLVRASSECFPMVRAET